MTSICSECACPYDGNLLCCPECGCPNPRIDDHKKAVLRRQAMEELTELSQTKEQLAELEAELEKTKINWGKSVKAVEDAMQVDYNRLLQRYQAVEYLLTAETAATAGDRDAVEEALLSLEPLAGNLDPQFREEYQRLADKFLPEE